MTLKETLLNDMKEAMKAKDKIRKDTIQMVRSAVLQVEKDNKIELDDQSVTEVIAKELKKRRDSLQEFEKSDRSDLIEGCKLEIQVLEAYMPPQLSEEELGEIVQQTIAEVGAVAPSDMGKVMQAVMPKVKGRSDGSQVNRLVKKFLVP